MKSSFVYWQCGIVGLGEMITWVTYVRSCQNKSIVYYVHRQLDEVRMNVPR